MYAEIFASRIKKARENTGFTQREVAKETGIIQSTIAKYEIGALQPDLEKLGTLATSMGYPWIGYSERQAKKIRLNNPNKGLYKRLFSNNIKSR